MPRSSFRRKPEPRSGGWARGLEAPAAPPPAPEPDPKPAPEPPEAKPPAEKPADDEQAVADFYQGRTIRFIVGFGAGGGFDTYARLIARHMGNHVPGNPSIIVENMPGAGSLLAANHVYNAAPRDGTVIGNIHGFMFMRQLFGAEGVEETFAMPEITRERLRELLLQ